jgi:hypothetical protein
VSGSWRCCTKPYERSSGRGMEGAACLTRRPSDTDFLELRKREVRSNPGPMGEEFSGNCNVASRNALLHNGATNATRSRLSDPYEAPPGRARGSGAELGGSLATANFREFALGEVRLGPGPTRCGAGGTGPCCARTVQTNVCGSTDYRNCPGPIRGQWAGAVRDPAHGLPRITIPRTSVHRPSADALGAYSCHHARRWKGSVSRCRRKED